MLNEKENSVSIYSGKVRVRVCGLLVEDDRILLLRHDSIGSLGYIWLPPGGEIEFGESAQEALIREFKEETNLRVRIGKFLFTNEIINDKHHAIELFFQVNRISGELKIGSDPELDSNNQILDELRFFSREDLMNINKNAIHNAFIAAKTRDKIADLKGLITFIH